MDDKDTQADLNLIWGSANIAREINRKPRTAGYMLENGEIPGAKKIRGQWCVARQKLREAFGLEAA